MLMEVNSQQSLTNAVNMPWCSIYVVLIHLPSAYDAINVGYA